MAGKKPYAHGASNAVDRRGEMKEKWNEARAKLARADEHKKIAKIVKALQSGALNLQSPITIRKFSKKD